MANKPVQAWDWFTWGATGFALLLSFQGRTQHLWAILIFLLPWLLRYCCSETFRESLRSRIREYWQACANYPQEEMHLPWQAAAFLVVLPAGLFFLANNYIDEGDNVPVMLAATSLASQGNWELSEFLNRPQEFPYLGGLQTNERGTYSAYPSGPVQFALPTVLLSKLLGGNIENFRVQQRLHKWTAAWLSAACLGLFFLTCLHLTDVRAAWVLTCLLTTGSAMYTTIGQGLWQHGGILFWSQLFILLEFRQAIRPSRPSGVIQGLALGFMLACRLSAALLIVPLGVWVLVRDWRRCLALVPVAILGYLPWAGLYYSIYGQPFGPSTGQVGGFVWSLERFLTTLAGVFFSPGRGFFIYQVWGVLAVAGLVAWVLRSPATSERAPIAAGWQWVSLAAFGLNVAMVSSWGMWWGGWSWGSRLVTDSLLLFALLCVHPVAYLCRQMWGRRLVLTLALVGFLVQVPVVYLGAARWNAQPNDIDRHPERLWSWKEAPFLYPVYRSKLTSVAETHRDTAAPSASAH